MSDWDAGRYDRVSDPQLQWGRRVLAALAPRPDERILDLGCGTGRLTAEIGASVPKGFVVGLDRSAAMLRVAAAAAPAPAGQRYTATPVRYVRGDGAALPFSAAFDAVFSAATLHWIRDHHALFRTVFSALRPGGRFVAQCGGGPNLDRLYTRAAALMRQPGYAGFFVDWRDPWLFERPEPTVAALRRAGFIDGDAGLEAAPVSFQDAGAFTEFAGCVCLRHHLERLPEDLRTGFVSSLTSLARADDPPLTLDYWRLNIRARRPPA